MEAKKYLKYKIMNELLFSKCSLYKNRKLYEDFLLNIVNSSNIFLSKLKYVSPDCESNGECDCISYCYKLDFKLLISNSYMEGKSISGKSHTYLSNGLHLVHSGKKELQRKIVGLIHKQLMSSYICEHKFDEVDLNNIKECLNKTKNLLLFLPYEFSFVDDKNSFNENDINKILTEDFIVKLVKFREKCMNEYDTYFVYLFNKYAIISKINETEIQFIEKVSIKDNEIYELICERN